MEANGDSQPADRADAKGDDRPLRVAIVGGGCAGLAAAWQLSRNPGYEVHVFERTWRLGGKGASGRDAAGRIHEHGLHIWLGFYENAFRMMRECYADVQARGWGPRNPTPGSRLAHGSLDEAFFAEPRIGVAGIDADSALTVWSGFLPPMPGMPGDPLDVQSNPYSLSNYVLRCLALVKALIQSSVVRSDDIPPVGTNEPPTAEELVERMSRLMRAATLTTMAGAMQGVSVLESWLKTLDKSPAGQRKTVRLMQAVARQIRLQLADMVGCDDKLRWKTEIVDIVLAIATGLVRDRVLFGKRGFDAINELDYREWLVQNGASSAAVHSRFIAGIYELVFAYDGDKQALAAGVALRGALRMFFTYRGSMFWRLRSGMGDAVFAPLFKVMAEQGRRAGDPATHSPVRFHFLHSLRKVELRPGPGKGRMPYVHSLEFETRGDPQRINAEDSQTALDHFGCWPDDDHLLRQPDTPDDPRSVVLTVGSEFDSVVFAMGVDDLVSVLTTGDGVTSAFEWLPTRWQAMRDNARTVATQASQVWLDLDFRSLGWLRGSGVVAGLGMKFETWADMTHTLATEQAWRDALPQYKAPVIAKPPRAVAYFCSVLPQQQIEAAGGRAEDLVTRNLMTMLKSQTRAIWPAAFTAGTDGTVTSTAFDRLAILHGHETDDPTTRYYVRANATGSERYTLSTPGTIKHRISPLDLSVLNMTIAGDWTACGLDAGCVEAAVMSGMLAAHAITGAEPALPSIVGYDHP